VETVVVWEAQNEQGGGSLLSRLVVGSPSREMRARCEWDKVR